MLNIDKPVERMLDLPMQPYRCIRDREPLDENFVYAMRLLKREYWGSSPELEASICSVPHQKPIHRMLHCVMFAATVLFAFFFPCE
jgi:hypothetical protein